MSAWSGELTYAVGLFLWNRCKILTLNFSNSFHYISRQWCIVYTVYSRLILHAMGICCFLFRPYFTKPLAFAEVALRWWTNQTAKCGKWESRATSEIFVAAEVISQPVALISGSRAQIATRLKLWMESQRSASLKCAHHQYFTLQYTLPSCVLLDDPILQTSHPPTSHQH